MECIFQIADGVASCTRPGCGRVVPTSQTDPARIHAMCRSPEAVAERERQAKQPPAALRPVAELLAEQAREYPEEILAAAKVRYEQYCRGSAMPDGLPCEALTIQERCADFRGCDGLARWLSALLVGHCPRKRW